LKGFQRVRLAAGESKRITLKLTPEHLRLYDREMKRVVEPGKFTVMVGGDSVKLLSAAFEVGP
jgi:beta-glucosidase